MTAETQRMPLAADVDRGAKLAALLLSARTWIHRRVDSFTLDAGGTTRRSISFDLTIPAEYAIPADPGKTGPGTQVLVPLALIEKGALRRVDATDPDGHPMPVLGTAENSQLTAEMLSFILDPAVGPGRGIPSVTLLRLLDQLAAFRPEADSSQDRARLEAGLDRAVAGSTFGAESPELAENIAKRFIGQFLLVVAVPAELVGTRTILKFAYDREIPAPKPGARVGTSTLDVLDSGLAHSQHVEVVAPPGLKVVRLEVAETFKGAQTGRRADDTPGEERAVAHVAFTPSRTLSTAEVSLELAPVRAGILGFTAVAVSAVFLVSVLALIERLPGRQFLSADFHVPSPSVSLLLIGPALFLSWMARGPEHRTLASFLLPLRVMLAAGTLVLLLGAVMMSVPVERWVWDWVWVLAPVLGILNAISFIAYVWNWRDLFRKGPAT